MEQILNGVIMANYKYCKILGVCIFLRATAYS